MADQRDVLVVGAGPTGLTLACDLQRRGVRVRIIDAAESGFAGSRAKGIQARTQEVLYDLGVLDDIRAHATHYPKLGIHAGPLTIPWRMQKQHPVSDKVPFPNILLCAQADTDAALRRRLNTLDGNVEYATRLISLQDRGDRVTVEIDSPSGTEQVDVRYVIGADGGASTVRKQAGIRFTGETDEADRMIVADVTIDGLPRDRWHIWPRRAGRMMALCPLPGGRTFQLMVRLHADESTDVSVEAIDTLVHHLSGKQQLRVRAVAWSSIFRPNVRLANHYRTGHVFLAGDAAHVHTPTGAQGLNTGIQDAYNLGWKLAQVLAGAPDALLDTYETERRPIAARVLGLSSQLYDNLSRQPIAAATRGDEERQLAITYRASPLAQDTGTGVIRGGDRAPNAHYSDADGAGGQLFDAFRGPHFTLLAVGDQAIRAAAELRPPPLGAQIKNINIPSDAINTVTHSYGLVGPSHVLVRPDGYVAYTTNDHWQATLQRAMRLSCPPS